MCFKQTETANVVYETPNRQEDNIKKEDIQTHHHFADTICLVCVCVCVWTDGMAKAKYKIMLFDELSRRIFFSFFILHFIQVGLCCGFEYIKQQSINRFFSVLCTMHGKFLWLDSITNAFSRAEQEIALKYEWMQNLWIIYASRGNQLSNQQLSNAIHNPHTHAHTFTGTSDALKFRTMQIDLTKIIYVHTQSR